MEKMVGYSICYKNTCSMFNVNLFLSLWGPFKKRLAIPYQYSRQHWNMPRKFFRTRNLQTVSHTSNENVKSWISYWFYSSHCIAPFALMKFYSEFITGVKVLFSLLDCHECSCSSSAKLFLLNKSKACTIVLCNQYLFKK